METTVVSSSLCVCVVPFVLLCVSCWGTCFFDSSSLLRFCVRFILSPHILVSSDSATFPNQTGEFQNRNLSTVDSRWCFDSESIMGLLCKQASKRTSWRSALKTIANRHQPAMSDTFMNNVHPSCGTDNESVDLAGALVLLRSNILNPSGAATRRQQG